MILLLSCDNLTLEKFPDYSFSGPLIYSRNACHEIGNQAEHCVFVSTIDLEQLLVVFL